MVVVVAAVGNTSHFSPGFILAMTSARLRESTENLVEGDLLSTLPHSVTRRPHFFKCFGVAAVEEGFFPPPSATLTASEAAG